MVEKDVLDKSHEFLNPLKNSSVVSPRFFSQWQLFHPQSFPASPSKPPLKLNQHSLPRPTLKVLWACARQPGLSTEQDQTSGRSSAGLRFIIDTFPATPPPPPAPPCWGSEAHRTAACTCASPPPARRPAHVRNGSHSTRPCCHTAAAASEADDGWQLFGTWRLWRNRSHVQSRWGFFTPLDLHLGAAHHLLSGILSKQGAGWGGPTSTGL